MLNWLRRSRNARARAQQLLVTTPWAFRFAGAVPDVHDPAEAAHVHSIERLIDAADVFVDAGACVGFFTCLARSRHRAVVAVEPFPLNVRSLARNLEANGWTDVEVAAVALADRPGSGVLYGRDTLASRVKGWAVPHDRWTERIALSTVDVLLEGRFAGRRLAIKVDVEGGELDLLRGAGQTLMRTPAPAWSVEISLGENHPGGLNPHFVETFDVFFSRGYAASTVDAGGVSAVTRDDIAAWTAEGRRGFSSVNYLFARTG
jgi:FkbM family methyltransferase